MPTHVRGNTLSANSTKDLKADWDSNEQLAWIKYHDTKATFLVPAIIFVRALKPKTCPLRDR